MPVIVAVLLAHLLGLLAERPLAGALAAAASLAVAVSVRGRPRGASLIRWALLLVVVSVLGTARRMGAEQHHRDCLTARQVPDATVWLDAPARPGAAVSGQWRWRDCALSVAIRVHEGDAPAGAAVQLAGPLLVGGRGLRALDATVTPRTPAARDHRRAWRHRIHETLDAAFGGGEAAAFARALVTGDASLLTPETRDRWAAAGLVHMLSVSGLHVAIVIDVLSRLLRATGRSRVTADVLSLAGIAAYVWLLGAPAPAVRAAVTATLSVLARALGRPTDPWATWALACAVPLHNPRAAADLGYQLSALGAAGLVVAGRWRRRRGDPTPLDHPTRIGRWFARAQRTVGDAMRTGLVTALVTLPLTLWTFGRVSVVGPLTNLLAGPLMSVVQPGLFLVTLAGPWPAAARALAWVVRVPLALCDAIAQWALRLPGAALTVAPSLTTVLWLSVLVGAGIWTLCGRTTRTRARTRAVLLALAVTPWLVRLPLARGQCALHVIDVGQGDALALETGGGRWVLVDAGPGWRGGDAGRRTVIPYLARRGGALAALVLSHADLDHAGGAASVITARQPPVIWDPGVAAGVSHYAALLEAAVGRSRWHRAGAGDRLRLDDLELEVVGPDRDWIDASRSTNSASLVLRATCVATPERPATRFLLTGDAEAAEEAHLVATVPAALAAEVLKVPHHGSRTSSTDDLLDVVAPRLAVVSVGADNRFGHPAPDVVARYRVRGIPLLRTDRQGSIVIRAGVTGPEVVDP